MEGSMREERKLMLVGDCSADVVDALLGRELGQDAERADDDPRTFITPTVLFGAVQVARRMEADGRNTEATAVATLLAADLENWRVSVEEFLDLEREWADAAAHDPYGNAPYDFLRADVLNAFVSRGWEVVGRDEESDYLEKGRLSVYAAPADGITGPFHHICIFEYATTQDRVEATRTQGAVEALNIHRTWSLRAALRVCESMLAVEEAS
jgi:hypothetical protein